MMMMISFILTFSFVYKMHIKEKFPKNHLRKMIGYRGLES